jgi:predicted Zn-dependent protease
MTIVHSPLGVPHAEPSTGAPSHFLSQADCAALTARAVSLADGGGETTVLVNSQWVGNLRWARNQVSTSGNTLENEIVIARNIRGARAAVEINQIDDAGLTDAVRRAERLLRMRHDVLESDLPDTYVEPYLHPVIWSDTTYALDAARRAEVARRLTAPAAAAGVQAAGYLEVSAHGRAVMTSDGRAQYYPYTQAQYSVTVRDPKSAGSGWAGVDWYDWGKIETERLSAVALEKCLTSRNPVAIEPGRYTAVLEPQAVCDLADVMIRRGIQDPLDRVLAESGKGPFAGTNKG